MPPLPPRASGPFSFPSSRAVPVTPEMIRARVLARLSEKLDPARLKRMPESIMRQDLRRTIENLLEAEGVRLTPSDRDQLVDDVIRDALGYGPLDELFRDTAIKEILVLNPQCILARRDENSWLPTNVKFRDLCHLQQIVEKAMTHADPIGGEKLSAAAIDGRLSNGFRIVAVIPPSVMELPPSMLFVRCDPNATPPPAKLSSTVATPSLTRTTSAATKTPATITRPAPRTNPSGLSDDVLLRLRARITERIMSKLGSLGVSDIYRLDARELQKVIGAYIEEYAVAEKLKISEGGQARLVTEIFSALRP